MASTIVGIDIGSNSVRAVEVRGASTADPFIVRYREEPLPDGSVHHGEVIEVTTVASALKRLWATGGFKGKNVALGIGGQRVFAREMILPRAPLAQIRESLRFQVQDLLPVPVAEAILDFYPISEEAGDDGPVVNGLLVAAIKEAVAANVAAVTQAGLRPVHVDLVPFALTRAMAPAGTKNSLFVLIGVGANTTNVVVVQGSVPHFVRIIAGGGDDITRAISLRLQINFDQAEALKRSLGVGFASVSPEQRAAVEAIHDVVGEQLISIRNTLSYYITSKRRATFDRVIISGGGTHLSGYASALSEVTGYPVEQASTLRGAQLSRELQSTATPEQHDEMAIAFGLALGTSA
jgi:type IV pilus assembly protein PilM